MEVRLKWLSLVASAVKSSWLRKPVLSLFDSRFADPFQGIAATASSARWPVAISIWGFGPSHTSTSQS